MSVAPRVAVVTICRGRHDHLERQLWGLRRQSRLADLHVVVAMSDPAVESVVAAGRGARSTLVRAIDLHDGHLPLAAARNLGVATAQDAGAQHVVLLDVDCIPSRTLVQRYANVLQSLDTDCDPRATRPFVLAGEVAYLPPAPEGRDYRELDLSTLAAPHPARPTPAANEVCVADDLRLFWSLSFALSARAWDRIGGFDAGYVGYGGEDTDFAQRLGSAGGQLLWVGGAMAFHQHHPTSSPPIQHLHDVIANANRFARRWGWWPMQGWLEAFADEGLARRRADGSWEATSAAASERGVRSGPRRRVGGDVPPDPSHAASEPAG